MPDIFISYSRDDSDFVRKLVDSLQAENHDVWVDFNDIPFGTNWWDEIVEAIENTPTGIFVISPTSVNSQYCSLEIAQLFQHHKRIVPIVAVKPEDAQTALLPQGIRDLNWIFFNDADYDETFKNLIETISTDLDAAKDHTRLLLRARDWQQRGHTNDSLARGDELADFLPMLERDDLTLVQRAFLESSLSAAQARYNFWRFVSGFLGGMIAMSFYTIVSFLSNPPVFGPALGPQQIVLSLAAGQIFGFFAGLIAVFSASLPEFMKKRLPPTSYFPIRLAICLFFGTITWITYRWFFLSIPPQPTIASFIGGIALSIGVIISVIRKPNAILTFLLTAGALFAAIFFLNGNTGTVSELGLKEPLISFFSNPQVYSVGIPMALFYALGINAHILWQTLFGENRVTTFLEGRPVKAKRVMTLAKNN